MSPHVVRFSQPKVNMVKANSSFSDFNSTKPKNNKYLWGYVLITIGVLLLIFQVIK